MQPTKKLPLFIVTGASGAGKSALCEALFRDEKEYVVLEGDLLWNESFNTPDDDYRAFRETWLRLAADIAQAGKPVVLCGCNTPGQIEPLAERALFSGVYYLAVTCDADTLKHRLRDGRAVTDEAWIDSSLRFNEWLTEHAGEAGITIFDTSRRTPDEAARDADDWIRRRMREDDA